ncbi:Hypothetical protein LUCI_4395 [Lucifera butyrica]|uniref:Methyl-accepting transducer domain-containing protein n=1 Tax=Lucifera butyrica TaxID=1351585 RepID=A0A498RCV2_9FIRM|nr:methyl-accepting chemotaxis protein [Lucifera butyrica]VBB09109.1 Hypothetical protein LUCI_4395 [Lucifera butyrica]
MAEAESRLEAFKAVLPVIAQVYANQVGIALTDKEKYLFYQPGDTLNLKIQAGTPVKAGTAVAQAMMEKRRVVVRGDKAVFGLPYIAMAYPVFDRENTVIGGIAIIETTDKQDEMKELAVSLSDMVSTLASSAEEVSAQTEEIAAVTAQVANTAQLLQGRAKETEKALSIIRNIAGQTNLLGLNAAIEAARVGEYGRGFGVVADEIRKLATMSADSVKAIADVSKAIQADSEETYSQIKQVTESIAQISEAVTHVAATAQDTSHIVNRIDTMAEKLTRE